MEPERIAGLFDQAESKTAEFKKETYAEAFRDYLEDNAAVWDMLGGVGTGGMLLQEQEQAGILAAEAEEIFVLHGGIMLVFLLLLGKKRESLRLWNGVLLVAAYGIIGVFLWLLGCTGQVETTALPRSILLWGGIVLEALLFLAVEGTLFSYKKGFDFRTEQFRSELMEHQYDEIKSVYMDMRGWRHDYHNHMQVMKAQLALGNTEEMGAYLDQLERELDRVDTFIRSGNLMVDAILNSKLTLARRQEVAVNCSAKAPERLSVEDVDLCVILGNLLDNAIEACVLSSKERFIRIYMTMKGRMLYFSMLNSAGKKKEKTGSLFSSHKKGMTYIIPNLCYFATSTARVSRMTVTLIVPG